MTKKLILFIVFIATLLLINTRIQAQSGSGKQVLYTALAGSSAAALDAQLKNIAHSFSGSEKEAFEGALLMRKAGFLTIPVKKLSTFKQGHKKLEKVIADNPNNVEYRFLRLMIQENAPKALGYNKNISQDSKFIKENYNTLPGVTQKSLASYSKKSKVLAGAF